MLSDPAKSHSKLARDELFAALLNDPDSVDAKLGTNRVVGVAVGAADAPAYAPKPATISVLVTGSGQGIDGRFELPRVFCGYPVKGLVVGRHPQALVGAPRGRIFDPVAPGCSVSLDGGSSGTLGAFMSDGADLFFVTASHSLCGVHANQPAQNLHVGDRVWQCASEYNAADSREIGTVVSRTPVVGTAAGAPTLPGLVADVAVVALDDAFAWDCAVKWVGNPRNGLVHVGHAGRVEGQKFGQASGFSKNIKSRAANATVIVEDPVTGLQVRYDDQLLFFRRSWGHQLLVYAGDSGSLVWDSQRKPIGMIIASYGGTVVVTPWAAIEQATGLQLVTRP